MISDQYKCIFVEVPKTGSTSIRSIVGHPPKPHVNIWQIAHEIDRERFTSYFKFGFVRNPWDRAVSLYERREGLQLRDQMSFEKFVEWLKFSSATCIYPLPHRYQMDWFVDPHGNIVVDYIGKFETLLHDWAKISSKLGIDRELPHKNRRPGQKKHYAEYYSKETERMIYERFAVDIEFFGYEFGA